MRKSVYTSIFYAFVLTVTSHLYYSWQVCVYVGGLYLGLRFTAVLCTTAASFPCCCRGSLPLANNGQHSASKHQPVPGFRTLSSIETMFSLLCLDGERVEGQVRGSRAWKGGVDVQTLEEVHFSSVRQRNNEKVSRMLKYISLRSSVLQLAGLRVVGGRLALRGLHSCSLAVH